MELPPALRAAVDRELEGTSLADLQSAARRLSERYRAETRDGRLHLNAELAVKAYLATRLPATYAAIRTSFEAAAAALPQFQPASMLDVGAGPGSALWAARQCWDGIDRCTLLETSEHVRVIGQRLTPQHGVDWVQADVLTGLGAAPAADLVTVCYVLDELPPLAVQALIRQLWSLTKAVLIVVEPGTPAGWQRILQIRGQLIEAGATISAPCPHQYPCPLAPPDWCHFARRVARSRLHRLAKGGDAPFEDEKFIYLVASRTSDGAKGARVLAPPREAKGRVALKLCRQDGTAGDVLFTKRSGEAYKSARRTGWGDLIDH